MSVEPCWHSFKQRKKAGKNPKWQYTLCIATSSFSVNFPLSKSKRYFILSFHVHVFYCFLAQMEIRILFKNSSMLDAVASDASVKSPSSVRIGVSKNVLMETATLAQDAITRLESDVYWL